jgi:hypothetical protein
MGNVVAVARAARQPDFISPLLDLIAQIASSNGLTASVLVFYVLVLLGCAGIFQTPFNYVLFTLGNGPQTWAAHSLIVLS